VARDAGHRPVDDLLTLVAGIRPASPSFGTVLVAPHPGSLTSLSASMPHPSGDIRAHYEKSASGWVFDVELPPGLAGMLQFGGRSEPLSPGPNHLDFRR
jgi:alpha-L-rhamnosidase